MRIGKRRKLFGCRGCMYCYPPNDPAYPYLPRQKRLRASEKRRTQETVRELTQETH